jgi:hypothetical protein
LRSVATVAERPCAHDVYAFTPTELIECAPGAFIVVFSGL